MNSIPIIDLFAGPVALERDFHLLRILKCNRLFEIKLSLEKR